MIDTIAVRVRVIRRETPAALHVIYQNNAAGWLPRSVVKDGAYRRAGERWCILEVAAWWCEKEDIGERGQAWDRKPVEAIDATSP